MYKFREDKFDTGEMPGIPPEVVDVIENKVSRKDDAVMADMVACSGPLADKSKTTFPFGVFRVMTAPILHQVLESLNIEGRWARPPFILRQYMTLNNLERYYELDWSMEQYCIRAVRKLLNDVNSNAFGTDTRIGYLRAIYLVSTCTCLKVVEQTALPASYLPSLILRRDLPGVLGDRRNSSLEVHDTRRSNVGVRSDGS